MMRLWPSLLAVFLVSGGLCAQDGAGPRALAGGPPALSEDQIRELIRQVADSDLKNDQRQRDYTYTEREERHALDVRAA